MKPANAAMIAAVATARAAKLCDAAMETLSEGRRVFVKGKPTMVPWSANKRAQLRALQMSAFESGGAYGVFGDIQKAIEPMYAAEGVVDEGTERRFVAEAVEVYKAAGASEVARRFG